MIYPYCMLHMVTKKIGKLVYVIPHEGKKPRRVWIGVI